MWKNNFVLLNMFLPCLNKDIIIIIMLQTSKIILISYKPSTYSNFLTCHMYVLIFGQAVLWPSLPIRATKKKENCCSLP